MIQRPRSGKTIDVFGVYHLANNTANKGGTKNYLFMARWRGYTIMNHFFLEKTISNFLTSIPYLG